jgi:hypothetical protein
MTAGAPTGVSVKSVKGLVGGSVSASMRAFTTRLVEVPMRVDMPPRIEANESGISMMRGDRLFRAAHASTTGMSAATIGVLLRKAEAMAVGKHRRRMAKRWLAGLPSSGFISSSTALVSSSARATTKSAPIVRIDGLEKPCHK